MSALIAIVGRPNVGKSALFNRIAGRRIAIVHDQPGVTRDRVSAEVEWRGRAFTLVDTGGLGLREGEKADDVITQAVADQVRVAIESAHVIFLVVNAQEGVVPLDREVAERLHRSGKQVLVAVNKADNPQWEEAAAEFSELGFPKLCPVSAIHGRGIPVLVETALPLLPAAPVQPSEAIGGLEGRGSPADPWKLAIVGRPNVGKSSLINALTRSQRVIVSPVPGTTRDAIDVPFEIQTEQTRESYLLIDTAGMRKPRRVDDSIEFFSIKRAEASITRCDLAILVLDAEAGIIEQDKKIAGKIVADEKACILVVNKWDLAEQAVRKARREEIARRENKDRSNRSARSMTTLSEFGQWVQEELFFLDYAPVIFTSAQSGFHLDRLLEAVRYVTAQLQQRIPTALLNRTLFDAMERRQPTSATGQRVKFFYATQIKSAPPSFLLFVNRDELFSEPYKKFLAGQLRKAFGYEGCPIVLTPRPRPRTVAPIRGRRQPGHKDPARPTLRDRPSRPTRPSRSGSKKRNPKSRSRPR